LIFTTPTIPLTSNGIYYGTIDVRSIADCRLHRT
jgi:hypothetical protein